MSDLFQLAHPILKSLENTQEKWIIDVLYAFNCGDLKTFRRYKNQWCEWEDLQKHQMFLEEKIRLLALMEVFVLYPLSLYHFFIYLF